MTTNFESQEFNIVKIFTCYIMTKIKHLTEWVEEIIVKCKTEQKEKNSLKYMEWTCIMFVKQQLEQNSKQLICELSPSLSLPLVAMNINIFANQCKHICSNIQGFL